MNQNGTQLHHGPLLFDVLSIGSLRLVTKWSLCRINYGAQKHKKNYITGTEGTKESDKLQ